MRVEPHFPFPMNCERIQNSFIDFEAGTLPPADAERVKEHLRTCPACQREWASLQDTLLKLDRFPPETPSPRLRTQFYAMLDTHLREARGSTNPFALGRNRLDHWLEALWPRRPVWQCAAALALLAGGVLLGSRVAMNNHPAQAAATASELAATQRELAELRAQVNSVNQLVSYSLSQQQPAHTRLQNVVANLGPDGKNEQALAQLLSTLAFDPSTNIRLSALETLYAHAEEKNVRQGVLVALPRESSPLVQVAMIDFLASVHEPEAIPAFQQLAQAPTTDQAVRVAAQRALALL